MVLIFLARLHYPYSQQHTLIILLLISSTTRRTKTTTTNSQRMDRAGSCGRFDPVNVTQVVLYQLLDDLSRMVRMCMNQVSIIIPYFLNFKSVMILFNCLFLKFCITFCRDAHRNTLLQSSFFFLLFSILV